MGLVEIKGLKKTYQQGDTQVHALAGVDLTIDSGDFTALVGPSGSGKTTLLNLIGGLDAPTEGSIVLDGNEVERLSESERSRYRLFEIGFVFQAYNLVPVLTVLENVEFVMVLQGVPAAEARERAMKYVERVGLASMANRVPKALSGGQQQRVAVARALAGGPKLVLADEPTANLDSHTARDLLELMRELNREEGMTFLFSTHDQLVMEFARRIVNLHDGKIESIEDRNGKG